MTFCAETDSLLHGSRHLQVSRGLGPMMHFISSLEGVLYKNPTFSLVELSDLSDALLEPAF